MIQKEMCKSIVSTSLKQELILFQQKYERTNIFMFLFLLGYSVIEEITFIGSCAYKSVLIGDFEDQWLEAGMSCSKFFL